MAQVYGYLKDPRFSSAPDGTNIDLIAQDKQFPELAARLKATTAGDIDLSKYCIAMNQYALSSCVGNGTVEALEMLENIAHEGIPGYQPTVLSRLFIYNGAREQEGTLDKDEGTHVRTAFNVLATLGVCTEQLWPYDDTKVFTSPSFLAQRQALGHKIHAAYRIETQGDQRLQDIVTALRAKHPVVFGTTVTKAFESLDTSSGPVGTPGASDPIAGGHCMVVAGYIGGLFVIKNSWGTDWGNGGFAYFTPDYMAWAGTDDLWVPTLAPTFS